MNTSPLMLEFEDRLETERLIIRIPLQGDGAMLNDAIRESIEELRPWALWANPIPSVEQSEEVVRRARIRFLERSDLKLYVFHKETGDFVASSGLHHIDWAARKFEIGYWIRTSQGGKGFMTEAVSGIASFAIDQLSANRVEIRIDPKNDRSIRVAERLGFTLEGILRSTEYDVTGQELRDTMVFAKVRGQEF